MIEDSRSHSDTLHSVGLPWTSDQRNSETFTWQHTKQRQTSIPPAGFEPAIPARERPQTNALGRAATGIPNLLTFTFKTINVIYYRFCGTIPLYVISIFRREVVKNCFLLGHYAASNGNFVPTFRDNLPVPSSGLRIYLPAFRDKLLVPNSGIKNPTKKKFLAPWIWGR